MTRIRKAIFPVAGLGTRFLPATKAMPKEMLPVVDRPLIQHVVDEARQAGIEHFIFVTGRNKSVIEDHFDRQFELELTLMERGKKTELASLSEDLPAAGTVSFTRQQSPLGLGHAVWCARELVGREPFALLLPDVLVQHSRGCLAQMIDAAPRKCPNLAGRCAEILEKSDWPKLCSPISFPRETSRRGCARDVSAQTVSSARQNRPQSPMRRKKSAPSPPACLGIDSILQILATFFELT